MASFGVLKSTFAVLLLSAVPAFAQAPLWGQCGGIGWSGVTTCVSGATCVKQNDYYSQCVPGSTNPTPTTTPTTPTTTSPTTTIPSTTKTFRNPIKLTNGSDPQMVYWAGYYYLTTTTWSNIQITRATTIAGLKTATPVVVWSDSTPARCCNVWAPEMHRINGRWYLYYTAGPSGSTYSTTQKTWVLQGGTDNPLQTYTFLGQPISSNNNIANLDSTVHPIGSKNYYIYSAWTSQGQALFIAELLTPATIGPSTRISTPTLSWETVKWAVNEGPYGLTSPSGRVFLFYSGSSCETTSYALGYLTLTSGANPLVASSWVKNPNVQFSAANGAYGPGHHGFFKSPSGQDYIVYHANSDPNGTCGGGRSTRVQKIAWNSDGTPNLGTPLNVNTDIAEPV